MAVRRPAAHLQRAPGWRRSGDESCWESLTSERELLPHFSVPSHSRRPQSAIEGAQLDSWIKQLQVMQVDPHRTHYYGSGLSSRTTSMTTLNSEQAMGRTWGHEGVPPRRRGSSPGQTFCGSSFGSQESLQTGVYSPWRRRGSCETVHLTDTPRKEQAQLCLTPVTIGWLPVQRKVTMAPDSCKLRQFPDQSVSQVKLKQPITPTFLQSLKAHGGETEGSHIGSSASGARTFQTNSPGTAQGTEKHLRSTNGGSKSVSWQALRRGWNTVRESAFPGNSHSSELHTGNSEPNRKSRLETVKYTPILGTAHTEPHAPLQGPTSPEECAPYSLPRRGSVQPVRATAPVQIQTTSAATTLIPQNKAGFSSITISSRKVTRSASLPSSDTHKHILQSFRSSASPPPPAPQSMDSNPKPAGVQRKATIVKVTEQRLTSSPALDRQSQAPTPLHKNDVDTSAQKKKAAIIKVTEQRESYSPARGGDGTRRRSFTEGLHKDSHLTAASPLFHFSDSEWTRLSSSTTDQESNSGTLHRSTLNLFVCQPSAAAAPAPPEVPRKAVGPRPDRPRSCHDHVFGHSEPSKENVTQTTARKWSFGLQPEAATNPVNSIIQGATVRKAGQPAAHTLTPGRGAEERLPTAEDVKRRASPSLTLLPAPDPHSHQSPEEVLALNAAAVIANIKLQRQLSRKETPNRDSAKDSTPPLQGNTVMDARLKPRPDHNPVQHQSVPHTAFVQPGPDPDRSHDALSLQEALEKSRPDFIRRSQNRVQEVEQRAKDRRERASSSAPQTGVNHRQRRPHCVPPTSVTDNPVKVRERIISGKKLHSGPNRKRAETKRKKDEERKREVCLTNRQRLELFKKPSTVNCLIVLLRVKDVCPLVNKRCLCGRGTYSAVPPFSRAAARAAVPSQLLHPHCCWGR